MHVVEPRQTDGGGAAPSALAKPAAPPFVYSGRLAALTVPQLERGEAPGTFGTLLNAGDALGGLAVGGAPSATATATGEAAGGSLALFEVLIVGNRNDQVCVAAAVAVALLLRSELNASSKCQGLCADSDSTRNNCL